MLKIGAIFEKDGTTPKESHQCIIGRVGTIFHIKIRQPLLFAYSSVIHKELVGKALRTSYVEDFQEDDYGIWVKTENTVYRFDELDFKESEVKK